VRKDSFQESLDLSLTNFPEKQEVLGRSKSLERSSSGGAKQDPRNGLTRRIKVEAFKSFQKYSKSKGSFSLEGISGPSDQCLKNEEQIKRRKYLNRSI
jgi:hypothetical protein